MQQVLDGRDRASARRYTPDDVRAALSKSFLDEYDLAALLSPAAGELLEEMAVRARELTRANFGTSIILFTPLYISNHCANFCTYCGLSAQRKIARYQLTPSHLRAEIDAIAGTGLEEILILTGESPRRCGVTEIAEACALAHGRFRTVGVEVQPFDRADYEILHQAGVDFVTTYQETYDEARYAEVHTFGRKQDFAYRFHTQERALAAGIRGVGFGALLGLGDPAQDALAVGLHAQAVQRAYPGAEISLSCPRIRPFGGGEADDQKLTAVTDAQLFQILCAYRIFLPYASITVSTRETETFRNHVMGVVATKVSAGVSTGVGHHADGDSEGDEQFEISDHRSVDDMVSALKRQDLQPVFSDHVMFSSHGELTA